MIWESFSGEISQCRMPRQIERPIGRQKPLKQKTDEGVIAKIADYIECTHYKFHQNKLVKEDLALALEKGRIYIKKVKDPVTREQLGKFFKKWAKELPKSTA